MGALLVSGHRVSSIARTHRHSVADRTGARARLHLVGPSLLDRLAIRHRRPGSRHDLCGSRGRRLRVYVRAPLTALAATRQSARSCGASTPSSTRTPATTAWSGGAAGAGELLARPRVPDSGRTQRRLPGGAARRPRHGLPSLQRRRRGGACCIRPTHRRPCAWLRRAAVSGGRLRLRYGAMLRTVRMSFAARSRGCPCLRRPPCARGPCVWPSCCRPCLPAGGHVRAAAACAAAEGLPLCRPRGRALKLAVGSVRLVNQKLKLPQWARYSLVWTRYSLVCTHFSRGLSGHDP
jgi:hypothetical protein